MKLSSCNAIAGLGIALALAAVARAETKVELKNVHLCCPACTKAVKDTLKQVDGVECAIDQKAKQVSISAKDDETAQKALDALAAAGFHGDTGTASLAMKDDSGVTKGKVSSLTVTGAHNCCGACCRAIKGVVKKVEGVTGDTAKPKESSFEVTGDFDAEELVKALNSAGFHVKVQK
jgi:copper chaperone CopZ